MSLADCALSRRVVLLPGLLSILVSYSTLVRMRARAGRFAAEAKPQPCGLQLALDNCSHSWFEATTAISDPNVARSAATTGGPMRTTSEQVNKCNDLGDGVALLPLIVDDQKVGVLRRTSKSGMDAGTALE